MSAITTDAAALQLMTERMGSKRADWLLYNALQGSDYHAWLIGKEMGGKAFIDSNKRLRVETPAGSDGHWDNEVLNLNILIPHTIQANAIGQPLGALVEGAGLQHRPIYKIEVGQKSSQVILEHREIGDYNIAISTTDKFKGYVARAGGRMITTYREIMAPPKKSAIIMSWFYVLLYAMVTWLQGPPHDDVSTILRYVGLPIILASALWVTLRGAYLVYRGQELESA